MKSKIVLLQEELKIRKIRLIRNIQLVVASVFNIDVNEIRKKDRHQSRTIPRMISVYISHLFLPPADYELIAKQHNLDRTSVYQCVRACKGIIEYKDKAMYKETYKKLEEAILKSLCFVKMYVDNSQRTNLKKVAFFNKVLKMFIEDEKK